MKVKCTSSSVAWFEEGCEYNFDGEFIHDKGCFHDDESYSWDVNVISPTILEAADGRAYFLRVAE